MEKNQSLRTMCPKLVYRLCNSSLGCFISTWKLALPLHFTQFFWRQLLWGKVKEKSDKSVLGIVPRALCMIVKQCHGAETASILGFPTCFLPGLVSPLAIHLKTKYNKLQWRKLKWYCGSMSFRLVMPFNGPQRQPSYNWFLHNYSFKHHCHKAIGCYSSYLATRKHKCSQKFFVCCFFFCYHDK